MKYDPTRLNEQLSTLRDLIRLHQSARFLPG
jgi:hypothetical protein